MTHVIAGSMHAGLRMKAQSDPSDSELLQAMLAGDEAALATLYRRRQGGIYRFAVQMSGSPGFAEDVTQEVFMALMRDSSSYDPARGPLNWFLLGMARNLMRQRLGRERFYTSLSDEPGDGTGAMIDAASDPLTELARTETIAEVRRAVLSLPQRYREVVVLCELQELSYAEAATVLDCAVGTVRSRLHRARAMLLKKMRSARSEDKAAQTVKTARCFA
ncbi:MAG: polymerase sigma-70 factor, subfamily [Blastocatellia bacterium]|jgi:RNA polymerase sigma-70 factor (ECF subfamily)|nr:polymerase sigma-70 factor, subfamily [Blastocatellia bacterium]